MGTVVLNGATSGSTTIQPTDAVTVTLTLPSATGTLMGTGNMPAFSAYQSSAQALTAFAFTKIQFQTKEFDTSNAFDNATNYRFTPLVAGYYSVNAAIYAGTASQLILQIYKNGSNFKQIFWTATTAQVASGNALIFMNGSTDYLEIYGNSSVSQSLTANASSTFFQAVLVRSA